MVEKSRMTSKKITICFIVAATMLCVTLPPAKAASDAESAQTGRLADLKKSDPNTVSLAVMPMKFENQLPMLNPGLLADLLGLVLESGGMNNLDALYTEFNPPADMAWEKTPTQLAEFLKNNPVKNKYVLFSQCIGDWTSGPPSEIRFVVTDAAGNLVLADRQTSKDENFKKMLDADPDPMGFSALVAERFFTLLGWKQNDGEPHGKFARKWAQMSGMPSDEERASMEKSFAKFRANVKTAQIAVYSTFVNQKSDTQSAADLASLIAQQIGCKTMKIDKEVPFQRQPTGNEQKLLWDLARAFRDDLNSNPPDADYAILAEYYVNPDGSQANAVHYIICEKSGGWVLADFQNSTHEDFKKMAPKSIEDCDRFAVRRLAERLK
jgi:hypothetical protein